MNQESLSRLGHTLLSLLRVLRHLRMAQRRPGWTTRTRPCLVLGNGPGLLEDWAKLGLTSERSFDTICVNAFAASEQFLTARPQYYVLADPAFWADDVSESLLAMRTALFARLKDATAWPMDLVVPARAADFFRREFSGHACIRVSSFNGTAVRGHAPLAHWLYDAGLGCPPTQNVLVAAIFVAICDGYRSIVVLGADHSWHEDLVVDRRGRVCLRDRHFYETTAELKPWLMGGRDQRPFTMDVLFSALSEMFRSYWALRRYATRRGVRIYNASTKTYIDAFERVPVDELPRLLGSPAAGHRPGG